jgi:hypothetical protein
LFAGTAANKPQKISPRGSPSDPTADNCDLHLPHDNFIFLQRL